LDEVATAGISARPCQGWLIQSTLGNHVSSTRTKSSNKYSLMKLPTACVMSDTIAQGRAGFHAELKRGRHVQMWKV
jgi:hypothetical protein